MQPVLAIARLTVKAALRFRLVPILSLLLVGGVLLLPAVIKDDGTARGMTQIVLSYTLGLTTALLGLTTLWLGCGTLARDLEECQMQVVLVKPVGRWQVWLGKWLGIMLLNGALLGLSAGIVYTQMHWRAGRLSETEQEVLRNEIFTARGSYTEVLPEIGPEVERLMQERLQSDEVAQADRAEVRRIIREQLKASLQVVRPGWTRTWRIDLSSALPLASDQYVSIRFKFYAAEKSETESYLIVWDVGVPDSAKRARDARAYAAETFHELPVSPELIGPDGVLHIEMQNHNEMALLFPLEDGLEVLCHQGGFLPNYLRGVAIIFCWLALLAAMGLAAATFLSFPVAAFVSLGLLFVAFSTGTMRTIVEQGTVREVDHETGMVGQANFFDHAAVAFFRGMLATINLAKDFSPIDSLSRGRTVGWGQLFRAVVQIVFLMGGLFAAAGIAIFSRRELATAGGKT